MSRYKEYGNLDDPHTTNGDAGFTGMRTREHPTQLPHGIAQMLQNIRCENNLATLRKGIDRITADTQTPVTAFTVPFDLGGQLSVASITRSGSTATLTLSATPDVEFTNGDEVEITGADQDEYNSELLTSGTVINGVRYRINDFNAGDDFSNIGATNETGNIFTATGTTPTTWTNSSTLQRLIDITKVSATVFTYEVDGTPTTPATGTILVSQPLGVAQGGVFASCMFSDVETNNEYIALAKEDKVTLVDPDDTSNTIDIDYNIGSVSVTEEFSNEDDGEILQVDNGLLLHRGTRKTALEWDGNVFNTDAITVSTLTRSGTTATVTLDEAHSYKIGEYVTIAGADQSDYNGEFEVKTVTELTFTYTVSGSPVTPATGTITATKKPQFKLVANTNFDGFLSMPKSNYSEYHPFARLVVPLKVVEYDIKNLASEGNLATATTDLDHGLVVGDRITISGTNSANYNGVFSITDVPTSTTFKFFIEEGTDGNVGGANKRVSLSVRDMFILSDIYDHRTYDPVNNLFRINRGKNDPLVGLKTWQNDNLIALYEKSIHVLTGISLPSLQNSEVWKITDEVGCLARKTVEIIGDHIVFLADDGVYMLQITPQLNLKGREKPLSDSIKDLFAEDVLNYSAISDAVSVYFNNRYYIALPATGETRNNLVYVYNFLNNEWESKDTFASSNYIDNWVICKKGGKDRLFATSIEGAIQLYEELEHDELGSSPTNTEIAGQVRTRRYTGSSPMDVNRWARASVNLNVKNGDALTVTANTENPDASVQVASYSFTADEDHLKRPRINKRGTGCDIQIDTTAGQSEIRSISVESIESQRANKSFE